VCESMDVQNDETGDAVSSTEDCFKISQTHRETDKRPNGRTTTPMTEDAVSALRLPASVPLSLCVSQKRSKKRAREK